MPVTSITTDTDALADASLSVVRISGTAYACGQNQSGTGFVVAPERVVTNAHVVAGVDRPVIEAPNGQAIDGFVVYFDDDDDLAIVAVPGLTTAALPLSAPLAPGHVPGTPGRERSLPLPARSRPGPCRTVGRRVRALRCGGWWPASG